MKKIALFLSLFISSAWALSCSQPINLRQEGEEISSAGFVYVNDQGEALITWLGTIENQISIRAVTRDNEGIWSPPDLISNLEGVTKGSGIHFDSDGNILYGWLAEKYFDKTFLQMAKKKKGAVQASSIDVATLPETFECKEHLFDFQGTFIVIGMQDENPQNYSSVKKPWMLQYLANPLKTISTALGGGNHEYTYEAISMNAGKGIALWSSVQATGPSMTQHILEGTLFERANEEYKSIHICNLSKGWTYSNFSVDINSKTEMAIISEKSKNQKSTLEAVVYLDGKWSEPYIFPFSCKNIHPKSTRIIINEQGNILAAWIAIVDHNYSIVYAAYDLAPILGPS